MSVSLNDGESGVAPGQACVLYDGDDSDARVLGGGTIMAPDSNHVHADAA